MFSKSLESSQFRIIKVASRGRFERYPSKLQNLGYRWIPGIEKIKKKIGTGGYQVPWKFRSWVPLGTRYRETFRILVPVGTGYRKNSEVGYRWVPYTDDISKDEYRWVPGIDQMKNCWYRWVPGTGQIKNCVYRCVPGNGQKQILWVPMSTGYRSNFNSCRPTITSR